MCNGWSNYETWTVEMWFGDLINDLINDGEEVTAEMIEEFVHNMVEEQVDLSGTFAGDCVTGILRAVNWQELAEHHWVEETND